jgi:hypothetical protein
VYERGRGFFGRMRLVSAKNFFVRNNDLRITVGHSGYVNIDERRSYNNGRDRDRNDRDWDDGYDKDRNDRDGRNRGF